MATIIERGCTVGGRIETTGEVRVSGRLEGSLRAGSVRIEASAVVIAEVAATERIDVAAGARIIGDLRAPVVELAAGAVVEGRVDRVSPDAHPLPSAADPTEHKETVRLVNRPMKRPTRPPIPPPIRPPPPPPRPASRAKLVTRTRSKTEDPK